MIVATKCPSCISTEPTSPEVLLPNSFSEDDDPKITSKDQEGTEGNSLPHDGASQDKQNCLERRSKDSSTPLSNGDADVDSAALAPPSVPPVAKEADAFLYYSNDKIRLEHLLRKELPHIAAPEGPVKRKTRISFEVDPFFSMLTSYPELMDESFGEGSESQDMKVRSLLDLS